MGDSSYITCFTSESAFKSRYATEKGMPFSELHQLAATFRNPHQGHHNHEKANLSDIEDKSDDYEVEGRFKRLRRNTLQEDYVNSSQIQVGSSSPMTEDGSQGASSVGIILINATQHFMCFLQFEISDQFLHDLESAAPSAFMYVNTTQWLDLSSRRGRESVVSNLCGLMIWARES
ncbi:hypothetical protein CDV31_016108 [Fusarium ambrosium]|uniref:Uncharacterized protein n=1 Tax=Fusarium ambrosium TaxID=131363 RepID=A0A428SEP2_9HYPO|nr:hypothetical protein CDV31_016108 [Fusarium ambrosium]